MAAKNEDTDFVIRRSFDAPRALVWKAWTEPKQLAAWWGPHGFSARVEANVTVGGAYRIVMIGPDGEEYPMKGVYREIVENERLVYSADLSDHPASWHDIIDPTRDKSKAPPSYQSTTTVTFEEKDGGTVITVHTRFESKKVRDAFVKTGMNEGWGMSLDKLDESFAVDRQIVSQRVFDAPLALVWKMWTEAEHLVNWWGPNGFRTTMQEMDVRPGGQWRFVMHGPDGVDYPNHSIYREVIAQERLVYEHTAPAFVSTVSFAAIGEKTFVRVRMRFATAEIRERTVKAVNAVEGLQQTLARLAERLRSVT